MLDNDWYISEKLRNWKFSLHKSLCWARRDELHCRFSWKFLNRVASPHWMRKAKKNVIFHGYWFCKTPMNRLISFDRCNLFLDLCWLLMGINLWNNLEWISNSFLKHLSCRSSSKLPWNKWRFSYNDICFRDNKASLLPSNLVLLSIIYRRAHIMYPSFPVNSTRNMLLIPLSSCFAPDTSCGKEKLH